MSNKNLIDELVIVGAGGHGRSLFGLATAIGYQSIKVIDLEHKVTLPLKIQAIKQNLPTRNNCRYVIAAGNNYIREQLNDIFIQLNPLARPETLIHPNSFISQKVSIGDGTVIMPMCVVNDSVDIGKGVIINSNSTIDHNCVFSDFSSLAPGVVLGGGVQIGNRSFIGIGSIISNNLVVSENSIVGAGSLVLRNVESGSLYYGSPAKNIRKLSPNENIF